MDQMSSATAKIPLVTTLSVKRAAADYLGLTEDDRISREVEQTFGFKRSRYFSAGRTYPPPRFGDVALVYSPSIEQNHTGSATPFDSGTIFHGYCAPFQSISDEAELVGRAKKLVASVNCSLDNWRISFACYLRAFYDSPRDYLEGKPPKTDREWGHSDLPANHIEDDNQSTADWRAWSWEIRFYEKHRVADGLEAVACTRDAEDYLERRLRSSSLPAAEVSSSEILGKDPIVADEASLAFERLDQKIQSFL